MKTLLSTALCLMTLVFCYTTSYGQIKDLPQTLAGGSLCLGLGSSGSNSTNSQIGISGTVQRQLSGNSYIGGTVGVSRNGFNSGGGSFTTSDIDVYAQPEFTQYCGFKEEQKIRPYGRLSARVGVGRGRTDSGGIVSTTNNTHIGGIFSLGVLVPVCDDLFLGADFPIARVDRNNSRLSGSSVGSGTTSASFSAGKAASVSLQKAF